MFHWLDLVLLIPLGIWLFWALRAIQKGKVKCGGCGGDCAHGSACCHAKQK
jgi:hypothetical protein